MNPWDHFSTDKEDKIKAYLNDQNIWVKNVTRYQYSEGPFCESCACPTGYLVVIQILKKDIGKAEKIGFSITQN